MRTVLWSLPYSLYSVVCKAYAQMVHRLITLWALKEDPLHSRQDECMQILMLPEMVTDSTVLFVRSCEFTRCTA